ncbi:putative uncharacterized protein [Clostridium sp. CAG:575]|nr:putative uncharacterized protein [Clostridium sp. CAG:575]
MKEQIIKIIEGLTDYKDIDNKTDLLEEDILDSLAFIELIAELENTFNIEIQPTQVPSDTWQNIDNIVKMVEAHMEKK